MPGSGARPRTASVAPAPPAMGEVIAGKYRIESLVGEGAMGIVMAAHHELLDVRVAIKLLTPELVRHERLVERFLREARSAARLKSEHVARVMDVGTLETGQPYIVMELLEGEDLEHRLEQFGSLAIPYAVDLTLQALEAMAHAHAAGIVHRDLKPANLFLSSTPDGREILKVLDFGIAKLTDPESGEGAKAGSLTGEHTALGSPSYMAPEQVRNSREIDHHADIWALGTILYEMVTGRPAFGGESMGEIFAAVLNGTPTAIGTLCPEAPEALEGIVARSLKRAPNERFSDVAEFARALAPLGSGAWAGHVERIEQTLALAGKTTEEHTGRMSLTGGPISQRRLIPLPTPYAAFVPPGRRAVAAAETLAAEPIQSEIPPPARKSRTTTAFLVSALAAGVVTLAVIAAVRTRVVHVVASALRPPAASTAAASASAAPSPAPSGSQPAASSFAATTSSAPTAAGNRAKPTASHAVPALSKPAAKRSSQLPGVLDSPD